MKQTKFESIKQTLNHFHRYPEKYTERDINQYKSLKDSLSIPFGEIICM